MVAYPHQQLNTESAKKGWLLKPRISQPEGTMTRNAGKHYEGELDWLPQPLAEASL